MKKFILIVVVIYSHVNFVYCQKQDEKNLTSQDTTSLIIPIYFYPKTSRNPFMSPIDYEMLRKIEEEKRRIEEEIKKKQNKPKIDDDWETLSKSIQLQGIVGKYAIINGEMVQEGYYFKKKFFVEKVSSNYVIIKYKGKRYKLAIK